MNREERYLCEVGYPRAVWRAPADPEQRRVWENWLKGLLVAIGSCVVISLLLGKGYGPHDTTAQMERLVKQLDRMTTISPEAARAIAGMVSQPGYDCDRVACDARLRERNRTVRADLATALVTKASGEEVEIALSGRPQGVR